MARSKLTNEQMKALDIVERGHNLLVMEQAGTTSSVQSLVLFTVQLDLEFERIAKFQTGEYYNLYTTGLDDFWAPLEKEIKKTAPLANVISCGKEFPDKPSRYAQKEFHGGMTRSEADVLLSEANDGGYFVRKSNSLPGKHVLSMRFNKSNVKHVPLSYINGMHCTGDVAFRNLEDLVNEILKSDHLNAYVDDFTAIHLKRTNSERDQIPSDEVEIPSGIERKNERSMDVNGNVSVTEERIWKQFENAIKRNAPKATKIMCQTTPENKPARFGNEFHGSLSRKEAEMIVAQYEDGHYLVRENKDGNVLTFGFCGSIKHFILNFDGKMHYVGARRFISLDDLVNDGLTTMYLEMCEQVIRHRVERSHSETKVETPCDSYRENTISEQDSMKQSSSSDQNDEEVPLEILAHGSLTLHAYHRALTEGKTTVKRVPMMFIGQGQAGKTSLKKSIKGEQFDPQERSTTGIETDPSYCKVSTEVWKVGERSQEDGSDPLPFSYEHSTAQYILDCLKRERQERGPEDQTWCAMDPSFSDQLEEEFGTKNVTQDTLHTMPGEAGKEDMSEVPVTTSKPDVSEISRVQSQQVPEEVSTLIKKLLKMDDSRKDNDRIYSVLWDFGGQSVYYVTHSVFLTVRAIYFLVYNLSWDPDEVATHRVRQGVFNIQDGFCDKTNRDYLDVWMSSVSSLVSHEEAEQEAASSEMSERMPLVFLVCTHADKAYMNKDPGEIARDLFTSLKAKCHGKHLLDYFVVDNTKSGGEEECAGVARMRKEVVNVVEKLPQMREVLPIKWLKYEKALQGRMLENEVKWISRDEAWRIANEECGISSEDQFQAVLTFLHDQRSLIHFDDTPELKKIVILDPQWLIDIFKKVIAIKPSERKGKKFEELWVKLETTGILDERLLQHMWRPLFDIEETSSSLVALMEKFCLLCPWPSSEKNLFNEYLVPSMLMFPPKEDINQLTASSGIPSLFVKFASGQVPPGLFSRLVLIIFQWCTKEFRSQLQPKLHQNFARFFTHPAQSCSIILLCRCSFIEVVVHKKTISLFEDSNYDTFQVSVAQKVCRKLGLILECMRKEFHWLKNMVYEMSVCCPVCCTREFASYCRNHNVRRCKEEECLHFWSESELCDSQEPLICTRSAVADDYIVPVAHLGVWFSKQQRDEKGLGTKADVHLGNGIEGVDEQALVLPNELLVEKSDANHVVAQLLESLSLEHEALKEPDSETKRQIRCLCLQAKSLDRLDVVERLRKIAPAGTTGPLLSEARDVATIPAGLRENLTIHMCGGNEWKILAERLGLNPAEIRFLDNRVINPCDAALAHARKRGLICNVGQLYEKLVDCGFPAWADFL